MKRVNYFELDLPRCANTYGVSPCTASAGADSPDTGQFKCFNSRATCQDIPHFRLGFPEVDSVTETEFASDVGGHAASLPTSIASGDLLLALFANDGSATVTTPSGWSSLGTVTDSSNYRGSVFAKVAAGTENNSPPVLGANLRTDGSAIGDMTGSGGLAAAFDNNTNQAGASSATKAAATSAYVGRTFSANKRIYSATVYGSNNNGYISAINPTVVLNIRAKTGAAPASATDGSVIGSISFTDTGNENVGRDIETDRTSQWAHAWVEVTHNGAANQINVAELQLFENTGGAGSLVSFITSSSETAAAQVYQVLKNNWEGTLANGVSLTLGTTVTSTAPDPPAVSPGWGEMPTLWIGGFFGSSIDTITDYPVSFDHGLNSQGGTTTTGASVSTAYQNSITESVDPGPFTLGSSTIGAAFTIGVQCFEYTRLRFSTPAEYNPKTIDALPNIESIEHTPAIIGLGDNIGERASLKVSFRDEPHSDTGPGYDKYVSQRSYDPFTQGTHWGKFRARWPYLQGANCRLIRGLSSETSTANMDTRRFIVEGVSGPDRDGTFEITAKDVLKMLDGDRAQAPAANSGRLLNSETNSSTAFELTPTGIGDEEYATSGHICVGGNEVCSFTRSGDNLTVVRGLFGTTGVAHDADERVQTAIRYASEDPADILADLLGNYADVPSQYIPLTSWRQETAAFLNVAFTTTITEPTAVNALVSEIIEQARIILWWSDDPAQINLQVVRPIASSADAINEDVIVEGSFSLEDQPNKRISQVWTFFGQRDPTRPLDEESNYTSIEVDIDSEAEANAGTPAIKKLYSRWIALGGQATAETLNEVILARYSVAPRKFGFKLFEGVQDAISPGSGYLLSSWQIQDFYGVQDEVPIQVTSVKSEADGVVVTAEEFDLGSSTGTGSLTDDIIFITTSQTNLDIETTHDLLYPVAVSGDSVIVYINSGVVISSASSGPALTVGSFAAGVNVYLILEGRIQGRGGGGGDGAAKNPPPNGDNGQDGTDALYTRRAINVDAALGQIWGGGGGGGGGGGNASFAGGGGGGGAGTPGGNNGSAGGGGGGSGGSDGNATSGGNGGSSSAGDGGDGGDPGDDGSTGGAPSGSAGNGGSAGNATDGDSFITYGSWDGATFTPGLVGTESILGPEIN